MYWDTIYCSHGIAGYELQDEEDYNVVGVYGPRGSGGPAVEDEWYVWRSGHIISEAMALNEAKETAIALYRLGET